MPSPNRPPSLVARHVAPLATTCFTLCLALGPAVVWAASEGHPAPEPGTSTRIEAQPGALLQALAYAPRDAVSIEFTDWAGLKLASGGEDVTSDSPLHEREALLLAIERSEAVLAPLGLDLLDSWPAAWGWDTTDLAWQLDAVTARGAPTCCGSTTHGSGAIPGAARAPRLHPGGGTRDHQLRARAGGLVRPG